MDLGARFRASETITKWTNRQVVNTESEKLRAVTDQIFDHTEKFGSLKR